MRSEKFHLVSLRFMPSVRLSDSLSSDAFPEELYLTRNIIAKLPWNIHNLTNLKGLYIEYNQLEYLPNNVGRSVVICWVVRHGGERGVAN